LETDLKVKALKGRGRRKRKRKTPGIAWASTLVYNLKHSCGVLGALGTTLS